MAEDLIREFLNKRNVFAVVGASRDPEKYGHQVYKDLRTAGYEVYPVNPKAEEILGDRCYADIEDLPRKPDVVDFVVPPEIAGRTLETCLKLGVTSVWLQPGSESEKAIKFCKDHGIKVVHGVCVMVERRKSAA
ncbi:MAG: CoA-binding protein [Candidatus Bathyarchaeota archaeon]|nr:CoA-binding protein [Candidatus Bathyarchaeota archaeon]MDH5779108.1 CoA-binding protein [Candidatus Bathyarchaeota archaeon]